MNVKLYSRMAKLVLITFLLQSLPLAAFADDRSDKDERAATKAQAMQKAQSRLNLTDEGAEVRGSEYVLRRYPGERLLPIRILGGVRSPGTYYVSEGTDLLTLVAAAGGLNPGADATDVRWNRWSTQKFEKLDLNLAIEKPKDHNPVMGANDVLLIDDKRPIINPDIMLVLTAAASVVGLILAGKALSTK